MDASTPAPIAPPVSVRLTTLAPHPCPYLPDRQSTLRGFVTSRIDSNLYHAFMDAGFRRSGRLVYQPVCAGCRACVPLRVPVDRFRPSKSQRRCTRKNCDLTVTVGEPTATQEKFALYQRYMALWHGRGDGESDPADDWETFESFLYDSPVETVEFCYRDRAGRLLAVGICDVCAASVSSVYFYHEPAESRRGLGTFGALHEIETARTWGVPHYYLGYWVNGCDTMQYKASFQPCEVLHSDGQWRTLASDGTNGGSGILAF